MDFRKDIEGDAPPRMVMRIREIENTLDTEPKAQHITLQCGHWCILTYGASPQQIPVKVGENFGCRQCQMMERRRDRYYRHSRN